ncbi:MAG: histidine--tRNA ligase [Spirochaetota bacterium]
MAMAKRIEPRILKGFRDSLPYGAQGEILRRRVIENLARIFERAGFDTIDTPALELAEILLGKAGGETEKQIYRFCDNGGRDVVLRFDLTVPFARFVAQHAQELYFPFKRYHIAKVWRGENAQRGRYREFYQCDFDIVGDESVVSDFCILQTAHNALRYLRNDYPALGNLRTHVNHRGLLRAFWQLWNVPEDAQVLALRAIDKLHKIGRDAVAKELESVLPAKIAAALRLCLDSTEYDRWEQLFLQWGDHLPAEAVAALADLRDLSEFAASCGMELHFDPAIVRGLDYYTGMVFETFLEELPGLGSICSGGRYDGLTQLYSKKAMPGVGASIGLDRLLAGLEELGNDGSGGEAGIIIGIDPDWTAGASDTAAYTACLRFSQDLQEAAVACDIVPYTKKINALFQRAEKRHSRYLLLLKPDFTWQLRDLSARKNFAVVSAADVIRQVSAPTF